MNQAGWQKLKDLFAEARELPSESRIAFLKEKCGDDEQLMYEVSSLLDAEGIGAPVIETNAIDLAGNVLGLDEPTGRQFGHYRIVREIGSGGMGTVFLAERDDGVFTMQAALKIIRQSLANKAIIERFRRERQILAGLRHPNIAALLDGGVSDKDEPFLVMEYVDGKSLIEYCEENGLEVEERLKLFIKVCSAVAYAHRNLVVHRDIKPSNILITADGEPKLLDFGLAKAFESDAETTRSEMRAFTPAYASPEQILGEPMTTATDQFSLGVVLFELITGEKPFHIEGKSYDEIIRSADSAKAKPPSQLISNRSRRMSGDVDNIVLKCLRREPERRYDSVADLSNDIERFLDGRPVTARPSTFVYLVSKFVRRNKIAAAAAAFILISALFAAGILYRQYRETQREKSRAEDVKTFLQNMLLTLRPNKASSETKDFDASLNRMLEQAAARLDSTDLSGQPELRAELLSMIGEIYLAQGQIEPSERHLQTALSTVREHFADNDLPVVSVKSSLAALMLVKANYDEAEKLFDQSIPPLRQAYDVGKIDADKFSVRLNNFATLRRARGDSRQAENIFRESLEISERNNSTSSHINDTRTLLTLTLLDQGKFSEAEVTVRKIADESRPAGETVQFANTLTLLGSVLMENDRLSEAKGALIEAVGIYHKLLSPDATPIYDNLRLQAQVAYLEGNYSDAENKIKSVLDNYRKNSSPKYISYATALTINGLVLNRLGRSDEAEKVLREALKLRQENLPPGHFMTAITEGALGECLTSRRSFGEAEQYLSEGLNALMQTQSEDNSRIRLAQARLKALYQAQDRR